MIAKRERLKIKEKFPLSEESSFLPSLTIRLEELFVYASWSGFRRMHRPPKFLAGDKMYAWILRKNLGGLFEK